MFALLLILAIIAWPPLGLILLVLELLSKTDGA